MNFEEFQAKLETIVANMHRLTGQKALEQLNELYEDAKGNEEAGEQFKAAIDELKTYNSDNEDKGNKGTLTAEQLSELEKRYNKLSKALEEAKELRENSTKDKIDDYVKGKIKENKAEKDIYDKENKCLKDKQRGLKGLYETYKTSKKAEEIVGKLEPILDNIVTQINIINTPNANSTAKESAKKDLERLGESAKKLVEDPAVKKELGKYAGILGADLSLLKDSNTITSIKTQVGTEKNGYENAKKEAKRNFRTRLTTVPDKYVGTSAEAFLEDIDNKYPEVEDKWKALGGKIEKNDQKIQALRGENKAYKQYAENVKQQADLEEKNALSDEDLENYLRTNENLEARINADADVRALNTQFNDANNKLATLNGQKPKDMNMEEVLKYKREQYLRKDPTKAGKLLKRVNGKIEKNNKKLVRLGGTPQAQVTMDQLLEGAPEVLAVKCRGNNPYGFRANLPFFKRTYKKQYYNAMKKKYEEEGTKAQTDLDSKYNEKVTEFRERYRTETQANIDNNTRDQENFAINMYKRNMGREPGDE